MEGRNFIPPHLLNHHHHQYQQMQMQINSLLIENQNLEKTLLSLFKEFSAAKTLFRQLTTVSGEVKSGQEGEIGEVYDKFVKMENEVKLVDGLKVKLDEMLCLLKELRFEKNEIGEKLIKVCIDIVSVSGDLDRVRLVRDEVGDMKKEIENGRAVIEHEKRVYAINMAQFEKMKKFKTLMGCEIAKLQVEAIDAEKRARAAAALEAALCPIMHFDSATNAIRYHV